MREPIPTPVKTLYSAATETAMTLEQKIFERNEQMKSMIRDVRIDTSYCYEHERLLDEKIGFMAKNCARVLDFGKSSRRRFKLFREGQIETADINQFDGYPDFICDICDASSFPQKKYDGIICNAVLEHVYDPFAAMKNLYDALEDGGYLMVYVPYLYRYHAPGDLVYQDYFRYSRDGLAYMFRDFSEVTLYNVRGRTSTSINNAFPWWKNSVESRFPKINLYIDKVFGGAYDPLQTSGYTVWARK